MYISRSGEPGNEARLDLCVCYLASFPGLARLSLAVRNSCRPGLFYHMMRAADVIFTSHPAYSAIANNTVLQR